jgi:hypothetical protein
MSGTCIAPEPEIMVEEKRVRLDEPEPAGWKHRNPSVSF